MKLLINIIGTLAVIYLLLLNIGEMQPKDHGCHERAEIMRKWLPWKTM